MRRLHLLLLVILAFTVLPARAALQFDVFPGFDNFVPEDSWFPIVCEIKNDGQTFNGTIEISSGQFNDSQTRRVTVELPTGTLKRIVIPAFSSARYQSSWSARLLDERGRLRAESPPVQPKQIAPRVTLMGAMPRTVTGVPVLKKLDRNQSDQTLQPVAARILTALMPDNPLVLEGLETIYLNSEKAAELGDNQVKALLAWLNLGGHLIVGVEQISDVNAVGWLRNIVPCEFTDMRTVQGHADLQTWLQNPASIVAPLPQSKKRNQPNSASSFNPYADLAVDSDFERADMQVATGTLRSGVALVSSGETPLIITSHQGRGRVTALMFSPERKPFSNWKNAPSFWAKLAGVDPALYAPENNNNNNMLHGGWSIDGVFGAMIDSVQVRKLPVEWLLLLLIAYLVVIGPLDQYWLKRIRRPMLTWITFPAYVVLFSLLIYFIGYKLRAGETEWNELHIVDVLPRGDGAELRGRTYASIYSPVNATYRVENRQEFSTFRGEFQSSWSGGGQDTERAEILQTGDNFKADIFVPVWTSQLYASDWWQSAEMPVKFSASAGDFNWTVTVSNQRDHALNMRLAVAGRMLELGELAAHQSKTYTLRKDQGMPLNEYVHNQGQNFESASSQRQQAFGQSGHIADVPNSVMAVSFISHLADQRFVAPSGLDLSPLVEQGEAILLAWEPDYAPIKPINQFPTRRSRHDTLWRMAVPVQATTAP